MPGELPEAAACGSWSSPLDARAVAAAAVGLSYATARDGRLYWIESRPAERGRSVVVAATPGSAPADATPAESNVRSRVHEYGGKPYAVAGRRIAYCEFGDQTLHVRDGDGPPRAVTPAGYRYADGAMSADGRTLFIVREDHTAPGEPVNAVVAVDLDGTSAGPCCSTPRTSSPARVPVRTGAWRSSRGIIRTCRGTRRRCTSRPSARKDSPTCVRLRAGPTRRTSRCWSRVWDRDGTLYFLSDRSGYWNLHRWRGDDVERVTALDADLGGALWHIGASTYALTGDGRALVRVCRNAVDRLALVDLATGSVSPLPLPFVAFGSIGVLDAGTGFAVAASEDAPAGADHVRPARRRAPHDPRGRSCGACGGSVSRAEPIEYATRPGADGAPRTAHAFFHAPRNPRFTAPPGPKPPLIVMLHGGPTAHASPALSLWRCSSGPRAGSRSST